MSLEVAKLPSLKDKIYGTGRDKGKNGQQKKKRSFLSRKKGK
jgi:hypothetical protein